MINILVVEDDEKLNRIVCRHLNEHGYNAIGCLSAVEAFDRMIDNIIGLIISDIMMPEVDGFKFAAMVREQDKTILILNADEMTASVEGKEIPLTVREFNILFKLLSYPKKTFTRNQLMDDFWATETETTPRTVDVYITKLREKFSGCNDFEIITVHGLGYKALLK
jgi:DNA-binding response OmpR family regulator